MKVEDEFYTMNEVIKLLKISRQNLYNWRKAGIVKTTKIRGKILFKKSEIESLIERNTK